MKIEDYTFNEEQYLIISPRRAGMSYEFKQLRDSKMKVGDYAVFLSKGYVSNLGSNIKNIWKIVSIQPNTSAVKLQSILDEGSFFTTNIKNVVTMQLLKERGLIKREYFNHAAYIKYKSIKNEEHKTFGFDQEYKANFNNNVENVKMKNGMVKRTMDSNVDAAKVAAKIATGRTVNSVTMDKVKGQLPMLMKGYADTPLGAVVLANIVDVGVKQFAPNNEKFAYVSDAMMQAAMVDFLAEFNFEQMFTQILSSVKIDEVDS